MVSLSIIFYFALLYYETAFVSGWHYIPIRLAYIIPFLLAYMGIYRNNHFFPSVNTSPL